MQVIKLLLFFGLWGAPGEAKEKNLQLFFPRLKNMTFDKSFSKYLGSPCIKLLWVPLVGLVLGIFGTICPSKGSNWSLVAGVRFGFAAPLLISCGFPLQGGWQRATLRMGRTESLKAHLENFVLASNDSFLS